MVKTVSYLGDTPTPNNVEGASYQCRGTNRTGLGPPLFYYLVSFYFLLFPPSSPLLYYYYFLLFLILIPNSRHRTHVYCIHYVQMSTEHMRPQAPAQLRTYTAYQLPRPCLLLGTQTTVHQGKHSTGVVPRNLHLGSRYIQLGVDWVVSLSSRYLN